jgi:DNA repair protein RecN (Recombination protein N)
LNPYGCDEVNFKFNANKGGVLQPLSKVASGGEFSRIMLSLKRILSSKKNLPTILFDEIDTGVSGEVADKMAFIMKTMSSYMQVISITHLPQIASKGNHHYKVLKTDVNEVTQSHIEELDGDDRVQEIAQMLSGSMVSKAAITNAKELLST